MSTRPFDDTREHLLATGEGIMLGKGFAAVGLAEILGSAHVPKGSFYHYFESKEGYGVALLQRYFDAYLGRLDGLVANTQIAGRQKLDRYFADWHEMGSPSCNESRCLVVKLTGEVSDLSAVMRTELEQGIAGIARRLSACITQGRADGSIPAGAPADELAAALYQLWLGAALVTKVQRTAAPFQAAQLATKVLLNDPN
ncbi:TetR/AcrR family transcriptional regulator [Chitinimonas naiadis]